MDPLERRAAVCVDRSGKIDLREERAKEQKRLQLSPAEQKAYGEAFKKHGSKKVTFPSHLPLLMLCPAPTLCTGPTCTCCRCTCICLYACMPASHVFCTQLLVPYKCHCTCSHHQVSQSCGPLLLHQLLFGLSVWHSRLINTYMSV